MLTFITWLRGAQSHLINSNWFSGRLHHTVLDWHHHDTNDITGYQCNDTDWCNNEFFGLYYFSCDVNAGITYNSATGVIIISLTLAILYVMSMND